MDNNLLKKCFINGIEYKCRTCFDPGSHICNLAEESGKTKSWRDLLREIVQLQTSDNDLLPNTMCCKCSDKLQSAYEFLLQSHRANKQYLKLLGKSLDPLQEGVLNATDFFSDCLEESTIDIPLEQYIPEIKLEEDIADQFTIVLLDKAESQELPTSKLKNENEVENNSSKWNFCKSLKETQTDDTKSSPLEQKDPRRDSLEHDNDKDYVIDHNDVNIDDSATSSSDDSVYVPPKRSKKKSSSKTTGRRKIGRQAPDYYDKIQKLNDRFVCLLCQKTFSLRKDCGRHIASIHLRQTKFPCEFCGQNYSRKDKVRQHIKRMHSDRPVYPKTKRKEWIFGDRLYSTPTAWRLVECKLCNSTFSTAKELRQHLATHTSGDSLTNLHLDSEIVQYMFTNLLDLNLIKESICKDIREKQWFKYYTLLNEYSYEMSISDTEVEDLEGNSQDFETDSPKISKYDCVLCEKSFPFKHKVFAHIKEAHTNDEITLKCGLCKLEFVSSAMYEQHSQTHCRNKNKVLLCTRCPAKFVWPENMTNHNCATKWVEPSSTTKDVLKCNICDRTFEVKSKLQKHLESHNHGKTSTKTIIRCGLCTQTFEKLKHLRNHMPVHCDGKTDIDFKNSIYIKRFERSKTPDHGVLQQEIQNAFKKSQISRFYRAIDKEGNEMDILDSDSEPDEDGDIVVKPEYKCELCHVFFKRRKLLLQHQNQQHNDVPLPFTCNDCTKQYVSKELLQQHLVRDCWNEHRRVAQQCEHCNARFIWPNNLVKHKDIQHKNQKQPKPQRASTLKCEYCEKVFIWPKDLVRHRKTHTEGKKFSCPHCDRKFQRKDNLLAHIRIHIPDGSPIVSNSSKTVDYILPHLSKPHGCKRIKCMICYSEHNRIRDLRSHLRSHRYSINFEKRKDTEELDYISTQLYPDDQPIAEEEELVKRIAGDIAAENNLERFYSITNENGYEVSLDSSETESDSEGDSDVGKEEKLPKSESEKAKRIYKCDICPNHGFNRKFKLYDHHNKTHTWEEARHICIHCNGRFLSSYMLQLHYKKQCKNSKKRHFCRRCPLRFMWKSNLKAHFIMDHAHEVAKEIEIKSRFECFLCQRKFSQQRDLTRHMTKNHSADSDVHYCLLCPKTFYGIEHLNDHLNRHRLTADDINSVESIIHSTCWPNGDKTIKCKVCGLEFANMTSLAEHLSPENPQNLCAVQHSIANYSITNHKGFELHLELDSDTEAEETVPNEDEQEYHKNIFHTYTCDLCRMSCKRKYQMAQHQRSMHNYEGLVLKCEKCIFRTVCQKILDYHKTTQCFNDDKKHQCVRCKFKFMWEENLENHIAMLHSPPDDVISQDTEPPNVSKAPKIIITPSNNDPNIFECMDCHRRYNRRDRYKAHFKKFHNTDYVAPITDAKVRKQSVPKKGKNFLCAFCGLSFSNNSNLTVHMRRHTGEKPFKCDLCEMAFPRSSDLHAHRRTHTGERPYKCMYCEKSFSRQYKLNVHTRIHTGERPYQCTYCEKSFIQSNDLTLHLRRHTGERPYLCDMCGEGFICATSLKQHRNSKGHLDNSVELEDRPPPPLPHFEMNF